MKGIKEAKALKLQIKCLALLFSNPTKLSVHPFGLNKYITNQVLGIDVIVWSHSKMLVLCLN